MLLLFVFYVIVQGNMSAFRTELIEQNKEETAMDIFPLFFAIYWQTWINQENNQQVN